MNESLLIEKHPVLYHMAEPGTWPSIREHGLLSTEALLVRLGASTAERHSILRSHRPHRITFGGIAIRDQRPMNHNLRRCLPERISVEQWFEFLNHKVFFWTTKQRLDRFRKAYAMKRQLIIEVPTSHVVEMYRARIALCPINSGATRMPSHFRSFDTFQPISSFEYSPRKKPVEFTVDYAVGNIELLANKVYETEGGLDEVLLDKSDLI